MIDVALLVVVGCNRNPKITERIVADHNNEGSVLLTRKIMASAYNSSPAAASAGRQPEVASGVQYNAAAADIQYNVAAAAANVQYDAAAATNV